MTTIATDHNNNDNNIDPTSTPTTNPNPSSSLEEEEGQRKPRPKGIFEGVKMDEKLLQQYRQNAAAGRNYVEADEYKYFRNQEKEFDGIVIGYKYSSLSNIIPGTIINETKKNKKHTIKSNSSRKIAKTFSDLSDTLSFHQLAQISEQLKAEEEEERAKKKDQPQQIQQQQQHQQKKINNNNNNRRKTKEKLQAEEEEEAELNRILSP
jgi:hypothetical protein